MNIIFLGTPLYVQCIKEELGKHFTFVDSLKEADLAVVAAYGKILTKEELNTPKYGCINVHPSLLPKYRGPSPIQSIILNGDQTTGITIIKMDEEVDHGPIIYQEEVPISDEDTFESLSKKMFARSAQILPQIIKDYVRGKIKPVAQNHDISGFCVKLTRESGYFDVDNPPSPESLDRMIRAYYPWPGVWTLFRQGSKGQAKIVKFLPARNATHSVAGGPEYLMQMEGKKAVPVKDFLNGYPDFPLECLKSQKSL